MARIAVVSSHPPFTEGGHLVIGRSLSRPCGTRATRPSSCSRPRTGSAGRPRPTRPVAHRPGGERRSPDRPGSEPAVPAYAVRHPRQVCWLNHTMREYYDQWPAFAAALSGRAASRSACAGRSSTLRSPPARPVAPRPSLRAVRTIAARLQGHLGSPPRCSTAAASSQYRTEGFGDYVFAVSRLTPLKRIDLLVRALAEPAGTACAPSSPATASARRTCGSSRAARRGGARSFLGHGRERRAGCGTTPRAARCARAARGGLRFVTVEAFASGKPVVTCTDAAAGGTGRAGRDGARRGSDAASLASAMARSSRTAVSPSASAPKRRAA